MQAVVDSNYLRNPQLDHFLSRSRDNYAVLTDYAYMEAYRGNALVNIQKSIEILAKYPTQVIILKTTIVACGLNARSKGLRRRLIDEHGTSDFCIFCRDLAAAAKGNEALKRGILDHGRAADAQLERIRTDAESYAATLSGITRQFDSDELSIIRKRGKYTAVMIDKMLTHIFAISEAAFRTHPRVTKLPEPETLRNALIFRISVCHYLLGVDWICNGGVETTPPDKIRNDLVDVNFAAFATYFDGLMSADGKLNRIYQETKCLLDYVFTQAFFQSRPSPE